MASTVYNALKASTGTLKAPTITFTASESTLAASKSALTTSNSNFLSLKQFLRPLQHPYGLYNTLTASTGSTIYRTFCTRIRSFTMQRSYENNNCSGLSDYRTIDYQTDLVVGYHTFDYRSSDPGKLLVYRLSD